MINIRINVQCPGSQTMYNYSANYISRVISQVEQCSSFKHKICDWPITKIYNLKKKKNSPFPISKINSAKI